MSFKQALLATVGWLIGLIGGLGWDGKIEHVAEPMLALTLVALGVGTMGVVIISAARDAFTAEPV